MIEWGNIGDDQGYVVRYLGGVYIYRGSRWVRDNTLARRVDRFTPAPQWVIEQFMDGNPTMDFPGVCPKCQGKGKVRAFSHVAGGVCFMCEGTGRVRSRRHPQRGR